MRKSPLVLSALLGCSLASVVHADEQESSFMLGIGVASEDSIYRGVGTETDVLPLIIYENGSFYVQGPELGYHVVDGDRLKLTVLGQYRTDGYEAGDSINLAGMEERKGTFELGVAASYETEFGELSAKVVADAASEHKGYEVELGWEQRVELGGNWALTPEASVSYRSDDLNNYYYGVRASEATVQRAAYTADADVVYGFGVNVDYQIDQQQMIRFGVEYTSYGSEIGDSTIVEDDKSTGVSLLYAYRF